MADAGLRVSFVRALRALAVAEPDRDAITCGRESLTRAQLDETSTLLAYEMKQLGVSEGEMVTIALPNGLDFFIAMVSCWKLGAIPQPVSPRLPPAELQAIVNLAQPAVVVGVDPAVLPDRLCLNNCRPAKRGATPPLPDVTSPSWKAPTSGGSTGRPKLIVTTDAAEVDPGNAPGAWFGMRTDGCLVMPGPLYHNGPLVFAVAALLSGNHVVVLPAFDAIATLEAIEQHRADVLYLVPTMMRRIWRLPATTRESYDLSCLRVAWHLAEPCPTWLKQAWIDWLGAERIMELYGGTEGQVTTVISGREWLTHRGSVGRPINGAIIVCDPTGKVLPAGEVGEVWLRGERDKPTYHYVGDEPRQRAGGWESLGDIGHVDEEGYLYLSDRRTDMILVGGVNVYPAEIEAALDQHPAVRSSCVIGLPDNDRGNRVHAIVEADTRELSADELLAHVATLLAPVKRPLTVEFVNSPLRDDAGKVRRSQLREARLP